MNLSRSALPLRRRLMDRVATVLIVGAVLLACVPLGLVTYQVVKAGAGIMSWEFLTEDTPASARRTGGGMAPAIIIERI